MSYASASDVSLYCPEIVATGAEFEDDTGPTRPQVIGWLDRGYSEINTRLEAAGYSTPVTTAATAYNAFVDLEALWAAAHVQLARMSSRLGPDERSKAQMYIDWFNDRFEKLLSKDLTRAGLTRSSAGALFVGGISEASKDAYEDDADRVAPRFKRDQFRAAGAEAPAGAALDAEND